MASPFGESHIDPPIWEEAVVLDRLSPVGSIMWGVGRDAGLRMVVGGLLVLDRAPCRSALAERLGVVAGRAPRLRQRPGGLSGVGSRAEWVDDRGFDANNHIRVMAVVSPGGQREILDLVAFLEPTPFDASLPPWDLTVIEGLPGGRGAIYLRAHHSLTDGLHGVSLVRLLLDESRAPVVVGEPPPVVLESRRRPGTVSATIDFAAVVHPIANGVAAARRIDPVEAVVRGVQRGLDVANSVSRQVVVTGGRLSPLCRRDRSPVGSRRCRCRGRGPRRWRLGGAATICWSLRRRLVSGGITIVWGWLVRCFVWRLRRAGAMGQAVVVRWCRLGWRSRSAIGILGRCSVLLPSGWPGPVGSRRCT